MQREEREEMKLWKVEITVSLEREISFTADNAERIRASADGSSLNAWKAALFAAAVETVRAEGAAAGWTLIPGSVRRKSVRCAQGDACAATLRFTAFYSRPTVLGSRLVMSTEDPSKDEGCLGIPAQRLFAPKLPGEWEAASPKTRIRAVERRKACGSLASAVNRLAIKSLFERAARNRCGSFLYDACHGAAWIHAEDAILPLLPVPASGIADACGACLKPRKEREEDNRMAFPAAEALIRHLEAKGLLSDGGNDSTAWNRALTACAAASGGRVSLGAPLWIVDPASGPRTLEWEEAERIDYSGLAAKFDAAGFAWSCFSYWREALIEDDPDPAMPEPPDPVIWHLPDLYFLGGDWKEIFNLQQALCDVAEERFVETGGFSISPEEALDRVLEKDKCIRLMLGEGVRKDWGNRLIGALIWRYADLAMREGRVPRSCNPVLGGYAAGLIRGCAEVFAEETISACRRSAEENSETARGLAVRKAFAAYARLPASVRREMRLRFENDGYVIKHLLEEHAARDGSLSILARWASEQAGAEVIPLELQKDGGKAA